MNGKIHWNRQKAQATTFMALEDELQKFAQNDILKLSLERFKEETYEISVS